MSKVITLLKEKRKELQDEINILKVDKFLNGLIDKNALDKTKVKEIKKNQKFIDEIDATIELLKNNHYD